MAELRYNENRKKFIQESSEKNKQEYLNQMEEHITVIGDDLYDAIVIGTKISYVSDLQRENMEHAYNIYAKLLKDAQPYLSRKSFSVFEHNRKLYQELLDYRREHLWSQGE